MAERVDQGDILIQTPITIADNETAATLNAKCHFAAVRSFRQLLGELAADSFTRTPQDTAQRTFFPRSKKPTPDCVIPLNWSADRIDAFIRALDFGATPSPIGVPKVVLGNQTYSVVHVERCLGASGAAPGTVLEFDGTRARVATGSVDLFLEGLQRVTPS
jgi:methionyl-tRNA formyltransferase